VLPSTQASYFNRVPTFIPEVIEAVRVLTPSKKKPRTRRGLIFGGKADGSGSAGFLFS